MAVAIIEGQPIGSYRTVAVLYDTVTDHAFGPLFKDADEANNFLDFLRDTNRGDPRKSVHQLDRLYEEFKRIQKVAEVMHE